MTSPPALGNGSRLTFLAPLSDERANRFAAELAALKPAAVIDLGCGWGELLLRVVANAPGAVGTGVEMHGPDVARARANAAARGLSHRVAFVEGAASDHLSAADLALNIGAYQAFGSVGDALRALRGLLNPGGCLLFGAEFWEQPPTADRLASMWPDASADDCTDLAGLVDQAVAAGFRPLRIETATRSESEEFESGLASDVEIWLLSHADHPQAAAVRERLDAQRNSWLCGHRGVLGFAYLTLGVPGSPVGVGDLLQLGEDLP
jgi:SAM-dependent methyltransferase